MVDLLFFPVSVVRVKTPVPAPAFYRAFVHRFLAVMVAAAMLAGLCPEVLAAPPRPAAPTLTLTVSDASGNPTEEIFAGNVAVLTVASSSSRAAQMRFCEDVVPCYGSHIVGNVEVTAAGTATLRFIPRGGAHTYTAVSMANSAQPSGTSATMPLRVDATSDTTLTYTGAVGNYTLTSTTAGFAAAVPTGSATFFDFGPVSGGGTLSVLGTVPLVAGPETSFIPPPIPLTTLTHAASSFYLTGDFNNDGIPDLIVGDHDNPPSVLIFDPYGNSTPAATTLPTGSSIVSGDWNRDGNLDIAIATDSGVCVQLGNGDGTFQTAVCYGAGAHILATADFNGDGNQDLIASSTTPGTYSILLGSNSGTFSVASYSTDVFAATAIFPIDYNNDGFVDLVIAGAQNVAGYKGVGDGTFSSTAQFSNVFASSPIFVTPGDLLSRGLQDLVVTLPTGDDPTSTTFSSTISLATGDSNGFAFSSVHALDLGSNNLQSVALADFDGDGFLDLVYSATPTTGSVFGLSLGTGTGDFKVDTTTPNVGVSQFAISALDPSGNPGLLFYPLGSNDLSIVIPEYTQNVTSTLSGVNLVGSGDQEIASVYPGDPSYLPSLGGPVNIAGQPEVLTLSAAPGSSIARQQVALVATQNFYNGNGNSTNGESISFYSGGTLLGSANLVSGQATLNTTSLPVGVNQLTATYAGDANFSSVNSAPLSFTVLNATSLGVTCSGGATYGAQYFCNVRVLGTTGIPTGGVNYTYDGGAPVPVTLSGGLASFSIPLPALGSHTVVVSYAGQDSYAATSPQTRTFTVAPALVNMGITCSGGTPFGTAYICNLRLVSQLPASGIPTGSISYTVDGGAPVSVPTSGGLASFSIPTSSLGSHTVIVSYAGDGNYAGVTAQNESFTVTPAAVDLGVTCSGGTVYGSMFGCNLRLLSKAGIPPGSISYALDGGAPASVVTNQGLATFFLPPAALGSHTVVISYAGQGNYNAVPSQTKSFTVGQAGVTMGVTCSGGATYGSAFGCNLRLLSQPSTAGIPTGNISYALDGGEPVSVATSSGLASFAISSASLGGHTVVISYAGQGNYAGVASQSQTFTVAPAPVSLGVTCSGGTTVGSTFGCNTRLLSQVRAAGIPTGSISYTVDGGAPVSIVTSSGLASFSFTSPGPGSHGVVITYSGNGNYAGAPSQSVSFTTVP